MDIATLCGIDAGGIDAGMAQNVRQPGQILFQRVICPSKQVAQVLREYLPRIHLGALAQSFHVSPDIRTVNGLACPCHKHRSGGDFLLLEVFLQEPPELLWQKDRAMFSLIAYLSPANLDRLGGDKPQFRNPNACGADGL